MNIHSVKIGNIYECKISGILRKVKVLSKQVDDKFEVKNLQTDRVILVNARRLRVVREWQTVSQPD